MEFSALAFVFSIQVRGGLQSLALTLLAVAITAWAFFLIYSEYMHSVTIRWQNELALSYAGSLWHKRDWDSGLLRLKTLTFAQPSCLAPGGWHSCMQPQLRADTAFACTYYAAVLWAQRVVKISFSYLDLKKWRFSSENWIYHLVLANAWYRQMSIWLKAAFLHRTWLHLSAWQTGESASALCVLQQLP